MKTSLNLIVSGSILSVTVKVADEMRLPSAAASKSLGDCLPTTAANEKSWREALPAPAPEPLVALELELEIPQLKLSKRISPPRDSPVIPSILRNASKAIPSILRN